MSKPVSFGVIGKEYSTTVDCELMYLMSNDCDVGDDDYKEYYVLVNKTSKSWNDSIKIFDEQCYGPTIFFAIDSSGLMCKLTEDEKELCENIRKGLMEVVE